MVWSQGNVICGVQGYICQWSTVDQALNFHQESIQDLFSWTLFFQGNSESCFNRTYQSLPAFSYMWTNRRIEGPLDPSRHTVKIFSWLSMVIAVLSSFAAPWKFVPLSEWISLGLPRRPISRWIANMQESVLDCRLTPSALLGL